MNPTLPIRKFLYKWIRRYVIRCLPELQGIIKDPNGLHLLESRLLESTIHPTSRLYGPYHISFSSIGSYSYVAQNSNISLTTIGNFCSIGPNLFCGWGIHPTNGISTNPMFYSVDKQNGTTLCRENKICERNPIHIGNDVFIGANVTILDGISIGDGAIIGAGSIVSKDIEPYAIAVGNPIHVIRKRFDEQTISKLLESKWWEKDLETLENVERHFFDVQSFLEIDGKG